MGRTIYSLGTAGTEEVQDVVGAMVANGGGVTWTYNDGAGTLTPAVDHGTIGGLLDDDHTQYLLLAGRGGGQIVAGTTTFSSTLTLSLGLQMQNGQGIDSRNLAGTTRQLFVFNPDNNLYIGGTVDNGIVFNTSLGNNRGIMSTAGSLGWGTLSPDRLFHVESDSAATNAVTQVARLTSTSTGTPANGIGVGLEFEVETASGNNEVGATIEAVVTDVTALSEDFDLLGKVMVAGATASTRFRFGGAHTSLGGDHFAALSPAPGPTFPHTFLRPTLGVINTAGGSITEVLAYNSYSEGSNSRAIVTGAGIRLTFSSASSIFVVSTAPSVSAGAVQTFTNRFGVPIAGRQWSNVTGSRSVDTIFQNTTGYEIEVSITVTHSATSSLDLQIDTATPPTGIVGRSSALTTNAVAVLSATVPNLAFYRLATIAAGATIFGWMELR